MSGPTRHRVASWRDRDWRHFVIMGGVITLSPTVSLTLWSPRAPGRLTVEDRSSVVADTLKDMRFYIKMTRYWRTVAKTEVARRLLGLADVLAVLAGLFDTVACRVRLGSAGEGVWTPAGSD